MTPPLPSPPIRAPISFIFFATLISPTAVRMDSAPYCRAMSSTALVVERFVTTRMGMPVFLFRFDADCVSRSRTNLTIASIVKFVLERETQSASKRKRNTGIPIRVVTNLSTTRAVDDIARQYGAESIRTAVGEINVAKKMKEIGALIGGEGSGGVILPKVHLGRDAPVGVGPALQHLAEFGRS